MALKHTYQSAIADDPAADIKPSHWNADHVVDGDGLLIVADASAPAAPAAGRINLFGKALGGMSVPAFIGSAGAAAMVQGSFAQKRAAMWAAQGGTNIALTTYGGFAMGDTGTRTTRSMASTNMFTSTRRLGLVSAATAGATARQAGQTNVIWRGNAAGLGGFFFACRFGCSDAATVADARTFVGLCGSVIGNVNPSTLLNMVGVGTDSGDANLSIMTNDAAGTATKVSLGANFPDHTLSTDMYELMLYAAPNASEISYQITRLNTGDVASGTLTTDLPTATQFMAPMVHRNNGTTALAVGIDFANLYIETDY